MWKNIKTFLIELKQKHKFIFGMTIVTFLYCSIVSIFTMFIMGKIEPILACYVIPYMPVFFIPLIAIVTIAKIATTNHESHPKLTDLMTFILNCLVVFFLYQGIFLWAFYPMIDISMNLSYTNIKQLEKRININNYSHALKSMYEEIKVFHFPEEIPTEAKNVKFFKAGGKTDDYMILKFDINKEFIKKELKKHNYHPAEKSTKYYTNLLDTKNLNDFDIYFSTKCEDNDKLKGIGINKNKTQIIYFYNALEKY